VSHFPGSGVRVPVLAEAQLEDLFVLRGPQAGSWGGEGRGRMATPDSVDLVEVTPVEGVVISHLYLL